MKQARKSSVPVMIGGAAIALLALLAGLWAASELTRSRSGQPEGIEATYIPGGKPLSDFELVDHQGRPVTLERLRGQWSFLFFGYTFCPDVCPTTMAVLNQAWGPWKQAGLTADTEVFFISVDPQRDTPERLAQYVPYFNEEFVGATGTDEQLQRLTRSLGILYVRHEDEGDGYLVDHSSSLLLINPEGQFQALFRAPHQPETLIRDYQTIRNFYDGR